MKPNITLKKLSEMLNMSISTVSRALKDHPDISEETRKRVHELADMLEYEPNTYAINLRTNNSKEFGVIVPAIANNFYHSFISSLEEEARRYGFSLIILQSVDEPEIELENLKRCKQNRCAGIFVSLSSKTSNITPFIKMENEHGIPIVFFDKVPAFEACNKVCVADTEAAHLAANALYRKGLKHILALFGDPNMSISEKRLKAFKAYFANHGSDIKLDVAFAHSAVAASTVFSQHLATNKPDAVFCMSDEILTGVMKIVQKEKIQIPQELSIVAISDGFIPQLYFPEITYAETSGFKLGKLAFSRMLSIMSGHHFAQEIISDSILINGGSL